MRVIALRVSLLACVLAAIGAALRATPSLWFAAALAVVGFAAFVAHRIGEER